MTHYFNKPLFTCAERDKLNPIVVYDVLSFILDIIEVKNTWKKNAFREREWEISIGGQIAFSTLNLSQVSVRLHTTHLRAITITNAIMYNMICPMTTSIVLIIGRT